MAVFAGCVAAQGLSFLIATQVQEATGTRRDPQSERARWDWATQWSLPKREALSLIVHVSEHSIKIGLLCPFKQLVVFDHVAGELPLCGE